VIGKALFGRNNSLKDEALPSPNSNRSFDNRALTAATMPPFFDEAQIHNALRNEALPELERLADNERLRDRAVRRFDRDEPPPYVSSTEDEDEFGYGPPLGFEGGALLDEFADLITPPLTNTERDWVATDLSYTRKTYNPGERYHKEALVEAERVRNLCFKLRPANAAAEGLLDFWG
jgi:hypothetical protein